MFFVVDNYFIFINPIEASLLDFKGQSDYWKLQTLQ